MTEIEQLQATLGKYRRLLKTVAEIKEINVFQTVAHLYYVQKMIEEELKDDKIKKTLDKVKPV